MNKTKLFYGLYMKTPQYPEGKPIVYCENKRLAKRILEEYSATPKQDIGYHIRKLKMVID